MLAFFQKHVMPLGWSVLKAFEQHFTNNAEIPNDVASFPARYRSRT